MILTLSALCIPESLANFLRRDATDLSKCSLCLLYSFCISASTLADSVWNMKVTHKCSRLKKNSSWITIMYHLISNKIKVQGINTVKKTLYFVNINCYTVLPRSIVFRNHVAWFGIWCNNVILYLRFYYMYLET